MDLNFDFYKYRQEPNMSKFLQSYCYQMFAFFKSVKTFVESFIFYSFKLHSTTDKPSDISQIQQFIFLKIFCLNHYKSFKMIYD